MLDVATSFGSATPSQRRVMTAAVEGLLGVAGASWELVRSARGEWRAEWHIRKPQQTVVLATIYVTEESEARHALIAAIWDALRGAGSPSPSNLSMECCS